MSAVATNKLREARALLANRGWCQNQYRNEAGCLCSLGALALAGTGSAYGSIDTDAYALLSRAMGGAFVGVWNDEESRTKDEVLAAFDKAIALGEQVSA